MSQVEVRSTDAGERATLLDLVSTLARYYRSIIAMVVVCALLGLRAAFMTPPVYKADMMIQLDDGAASSSARSLLGEAATLFDGKSSAAAEAQIIGSRLVVARAVDRLQSQVEVTPYRLPFIGGLMRAGDTSADIERFDVPVALEGKPFALTMLSDRAWSLSGPGLRAPVDGEVGTEAMISSSHGEIHLKVSGFHATGGTQFILTRRSRLKTIDSVRRALVVHERVKQSGIIVATLSGPDRHQVSALLREIGEQYIRQNVERKSAEAAQALEFLDTQLPALKQQLEQVQGRYTAMNAEHGIVDLSEEAKLAIRTAAEADAKLLALTHRRDELATRFTDSHPAMQAIEQQIAAVRHRQRAFDETVRRLPGLQQRSAEMTLDLHVATDLYRVLLGSTQQLQLMKAGRVASARIVDVAVTAEEPVGPRRMAKVGLFLMVGLVTGVGLALLRGWLAGAVSVSEQIEQGLGINVLAIVPQSTGQRRLHERLLDRVRGLRAERREGQPVAVTDPSDPAVESLRSLRTALLLSAVGRDRNVLMIAGAEPGAGKSFVAVNLAAVLAAGGERVLLIDADMRRGRLHHVLGVQQEPGLANVLGDDVSAAVPVRRDVMPGVDLVTRGGHQPAVGELLLADRAATLIDGFRSRYGWVVIDTPPVLGVTDATMLARHADVLLLVARAGRSRMADLSQTCKRLRLCGLEPTGAILNGVTSRAGSYGYDYREDSGQ